MDKLIFLVPVMGAIGLIYTFIKTNWVAKQDAGNDRMKEISNYIAEGAMAFLRAEWKILGYFVVLVGILLAVMATANPHSHWSIAIAFVVGAVLSATAGFIGMRVATKANVRTAQAARTSLSKALNVSFTGGSVMGMGVAGLAVMGLGWFVYYLRQIFADGMPVNGPEMLKAIEVLTGFSLEQKVLHYLHAWVAASIQRRADVGADLVGKVEAGIPEDDPRNPATIADNVGDNVGDVGRNGCRLVRFLCCNCISLQSY
jgi:K(+)-stimulated pyrophosphate-energized sodium pump